MRRVLMQIIGVLNVLLASAGFCYSLSFAFLPGFTNGHRLSAGGWLLFIVSTGIAFSLMAAVAYVGFRLVQRDRRAVDRACLLFAAELVYLMSMLTIQSLGSPARQSLLMILFWSDAPLVPQEVTLYPILGLIICVWLRTPQKTKGHPIPVQ